MLKKACSLKGISICHYVGLSLSLLSEEGIEHIRSLSFVLGGSGKNLSPLHSLIRACESLPCGSSHTYILAGLTFPIEIKTLNNHCKIAAALYPNQLPLGYCRDSL